MFIDHENKLGYPYLYSCRASNDLGELFQNVVLLEGEKPSQPNLKVLSVMQNEVKVLVTYGASRLLGKRFPILGYIIEYKPHCITASSESSESDWVLAEGDSETMENNEGESVVLIQ